MSNFKIIIIAVFVVFAIVGIIFFAGFGGSGGGNTTIGPVVIWGTLDARTMNGLLKEIRAVREDFDTVTYIEKDERTFDTEFVNALAVGIGPDLILLSQDSILKHRDKIINISYDVYSQRTFKDTFIEEGELYMTPDGILGLPFTIDPMVLYWNRDILSSAGVSAPPRYWDELFTLSPIITQRDRAANIVTSLTALGEYRNVDHAKEILSTLIIQAGNKIINRHDGELEVVLREQGESVIAPAEAALRFYTEFSNPVKSVYSWNRALPSSRQSFIAGDLALYIGFASELVGLRNANPNLNFDVAPLPQSRDGSTKITFGKMSSFAIPRTAPNPNASFSAALALTSQEPLIILAEVTGLPPVRRDLLAVRPTDAFRSIFYDSALMARAWLDSNDEKSGEIFKDMIENVISGRSRLSEAVRIADEELKNLLQ